MSAQSLNHPCNTDPFAVCECGRPGTYAFAQNTTMAEDVELVFEYVEAAATDARFTNTEVQMATGVRYSTAPKVLRLMEHHGYVRRTGTSSRPIIWQRAAPVGTP